MFKIIFAGVVLTPPLDFVREVLSLLGVEDMSDLTLALFERLGFKRG